MKLVIPDFTIPFITAIHNSKRSWENLFIVLAIIIGILAQVLVFVEHEFTYGFMPLASGFSIVLWVAAISPVILTIIIIRLYTEANQNSKHQKSRVEKTILQLEAKALRAQMNPHFIFNCMNSIKLLIQQKEEDKAIIYLTTFSKLIRTVFQNSDKREITLHDEIETCRLYTQLESMRFNNKFSYEFDIDETLDLKSVMVPALIVQPFIENAIWHGIMPKEEGGRLTVKVSKTDHTITCIIDDDGIGRVISKGNKFLSVDQVHESKGEYLTQERLNLDNLLNERNARIEIIDKQINAEKPSGTTVILTFKEEQ